MGIKICKNTSILQIKDYGCPVRKLPSLHRQKYPPTPKFLGMAKAYFVCHIGPTFQISLIYPSLGVPSQEKSGLWTFILPALNLPWPPLILNLSKKCGVSANGLGLYGFEYCLSTRWKACKPHDTRRAKCCLKGHFLQKRLQMTTRLQSIDSSQKNRGGKWQPWMKLLNSIWKVTWFTVFITLLMNK